MVDIMFKFLDKVVANELAHLNDHVPTEVRPIENILKSKAFVFKLTDSSSYFISESEFYDFISNIPKKLYKYVTLPFIFTRRIDLGRGAYTVGGSKYNTLAVRIVLGDFPEINADNFNDYLNDLGSILYTPHIQKFRKIYRSLSVIAFGVI